MRVEPHDGEALDAGMPAPGSRPCGRSSSRPARAASRAAPPQAPRLLVERVAGDDDRLGVRQRQQRRLGHRLPTHAPGARRRAPDPPRTWLRSCGTRSRARARPPSSCGRAGSVLSASTRHRTAFLSRRCVARTGPAYSPPAYCWAVELRAMTQDDWPAVASIYADGLATGAATFETASLRGRSGTPLICPRRGSSPSRARASADGSRSLASRRAGATAVSSSTASTSRRTAEVSCNSSTCCDALDDIRHAAKLAGSVFRRSAASGWRSYNRAARASSLILPTRAATGPLEPLRSQIETAAQPVKKIARTRTLSVLRSYLKWLWERNNYRSRRNAAHSSIS